VERGKAIVGEEFDVLPTFLSIKLVSFIREEILLGLNLHEISYSDRGFIEAFISLQEHNGIAFLLQKSHVLPSPSL
jgi:hypothetical protein